MAFTLGDCIIRIEQEQIFMELNTVQKIEPKEYSEKEMLEIE